LKWFEDHKPETIRAVVVSVLTLADVCKEHGLPLINYAFGGGSSKDKPNKTDSFYFRTQAKVRSQKQCFKIRFATTIVIATLGSNLELR
jgi:hypothetical protein